MTKVVARSSRQCNGAAKANFKNVLLTGKKNKYFLPHLTIPEFLCFLKSFEIFLSVVEAMSNGENTRDHKFVIEDNLDLERQSWYGFLLGLGRFNAQHYLFSLPLIIKSL